jgi:nitrogen regulatory protein P-II 1
MLLLELVVIVLNKPQYLSEILDGFVEDGIKGATVIDSSGMGHLIADHVPFFLQFADLDDSQGNHSKTIFTVVNCKEERDKVVQNVEHVIGDITRPDTAFIFSVPVNFVKGLTLKGCGDCK